MKNKLSQQQHEQSFTGHDTKHEHALEFASAEEMLRHDALHTPVPPSIANRLQESLPRFEPSRPWWKRLLGS
jgi:hypothetical protein